MERKFERKVKQKNPQNPTGNRNIKTNEFDINADTIREQKNKN